MLLRFEFGGTGMFNALGLFAGCDMERRDAEELEKIEDVFNRDLPCPDITPPKNTRFWFTSEGVAKFREELKSFMYLSSRYSEDARLGVLRVVAKNAADNIVYADRWQVAEEAE